MLEFLHDKPLRTLRMWQTYLNFAIFACAFVSIALSFASLGTLALLMLVPTALLFVAAIILAVQLYKINARRRAELLAQNAAEVEPELRALLDGRDLDSPAAQLAANRPAGGGRWGNLNTRGTETQRGKKRG